MALRLYLLTITAANERTLINPLILQPYIARLNEYGIPKMTRDNQMFKDKITFGPKGNQHMLMKTPVQQWTTEKEAYEAMSTQERSFWNNLKTLLNKTDYVKSMLTYYQESKGTEVLHNQFDIVLNYIGETKLGYLSSYRTLMSKSKQMSSNVNVTLSKIKMDVMAQTQLMSHMMQKDTVFFGCNDLEWLRLIVNTTAVIENRLTAEDVSELTDEEELIDISEDEEEVSPLAAFGLTTDMFHNKPEETDNPYKTFARALMLPDSKRKFEYEEQETENFPKRSKNANYIKYIYNKMKELGVHTKDSLKKQMFEVNDEKEFMQLLHINSLQNSNRIYEEAAGMLQLDNALPTFYEEFMSDKFTEETMSAEVTWDLYRDYCNEMNMPTWLLLLELYAITKQLTNKRNTVCLYGSSNAGKTFWIEKCLLKYAKNVARPNEQLEFRWGDCCDGNIILVNELELNTKSQVDTFKKIAEGIDTPVAVKFGRPKELKRKPVILTLNYPPWNRCQYEDKLALQNRMFTHNFVKPSHVLAEFQRVSYGTSPNPDFMRTVFRLFENITKDDADFIMERIQTEMWKVDGKDCADLIEEQFNKND